jgi:hypothetical protein
MDSDKGSAQVERLEVVAQAGGGAAIWRFALFAASMATVMSRRILPIERALYRRWWSRKRGRCLARSGRPAAARSRSSLRPELG